MKTYLAAAWLTVVVIGILKFVYDICGVNGMFTLLGIIAFAVATTASIVCLISEYVNASDAQAKEAREADRAAGG